jgi:hypothetical protein
MRSLSARLAGSFRRSAVGLPALLVVACVMLVASASAGALTITSFDGEVSNADGTPATQAGSHPYQATTHFSFGTVTKPSNGDVLPDGSAKDLVVELPPGFVGNPMATPRCSQADFAIASRNPAGAVNGTNTTNCPDSTAVGVTTLTIGFFGFLEETFTPAAVYNLVPPPGVAAEFGFVVESVRVKLNGKVRTGGDYGLDVSLSSIPQGLALAGSSLTFWGVPSDPSHDALRGLCATIGGSCPSQGPSTPFLTNPTLCDGPLSTTLRVDSWQEPEVKREASFITHDNANPPNTVAPTGCGVVPFEPSLSVQPGNQEAGAPSGYSVDLRLPQNENPAGLAESALKKAVVELPQGVTVSPGAASGLGACSPEQIGLDEADAPSCPASAKIGSVAVQTPIQEHPLEGSVYLAEQGNNPFGSLLALYVVAEGNGVILKLAGHVEADPLSGRLTATFDSNPQLPFSDLKLAFKNGPRAPLVNPSKCGSYATRSQLTSWSGKTVESDSSFQVTQGENGAPCPTGGFAPSFSAGTVKPQAGGYSPFTLTFSRSDQESALGGVSVRMPDGLLGAIRNVPLCPAAQASSGTCGAESLIGTATVAAGAGANPFWIGGKVFLTGSYSGAPFGLSVVVPAIAGPFNLGTVVVRAAISIDPHTAQVAITSDSLPTILQGIPLQIKSVNVTIDRSDFTFNPTNCETQSVGATISGAEGSSAIVSSPFQAANCATLPFKPKLTASTQGKASKAEGAALTVAISAKGGPQPGGGEANIKKVEVQLPKQLPSRLTTLQKACSEAQFNANPAACPHESNVGTAEASTPVLANPLKGPAYLVSHGGAAFPDLEIVLQGEGITLVLDGKTQITKGITYSRFQTVPDAPISSFELSLPTGKFSILGTDLPESAKYNLCTQSLQMPTRITGQNGAVIEQKTPIAIGGCSTSMSIVSHRLNAKTVTLSVYIPAAGTLKVSGKGLRQVTKTSKGRETLSLSLSQKRAGKLSTKLKLRFVPSKGKPQSRSLSAKFKK